MLPISHPNGRWAHSGPLREMSGWVSRSFSGFISSPNENGMMRSRMRSAPRTISGKLWRGSPFQSCMSNNLLHSEGPRLYKCRHEYEAPALCAVRICRGGADLGHGPGLPAEWIGHPDGGVDRKRDDSGAASE